MEANGVILRVNGMDGREYAVYSPSIAEAREAVSRFVSHATEATLLLVASGGGVHLKEILLRSASLAARAMSEALAIVMRIPADDVERVVRASDVKRIVQALDEDMGLSMLSGALSTWLSSLIAKRGVSSPEGSTVENDVSDPTTGEEAPPI